MDKFFKNTQGTLHSHSYLARVAQHSMRFARCTSLTHIFIPVGRKNIVYAGTLLH